MKKIFIVMAVFFISLSLSACGESEAERIVEEARASLLIYDTDISQIRGSFNVPLEARGGVEVSWEVSDENLLELGDIYEGDIREQRIIVHRPEEEGNHQDITLTATLTYEDVTATREYEGRVMAQVPTTVYDSFDDLYNEASVGDDVVVRGVVVARVGSGYFVSDGTYVLSVFQGGNFDLGDELEITGSYARWNSLYQISGPDEEELISSGNDYNLDATPLSFADLYDEDTFDTSDPRTHGVLHNLEGIVVRGDLAGSGYTNYYLQDVEDPSRFFLFTHYSRSQALDYLADYQGEYVSIDVRLYANHARDGFLMFFDEADANVEVLELDEQQQLEADISALESATNITNDDFELPEQGPRGSEIDGWSSSDISIIGHDGTINNLPDTFEDVEFTSDIAYGEAEGEVTITVTVVGNSTIDVDSALSVADGDRAHVEGVVTAFSVFHNGFFMQDEDGYGIYVSLADRDLDAFEDVEVGNKITVFGELGRWGNHNNNQRQITGHKLLTSNDEGEHDLVIETEMSLMDIFNDFIPFDEDAHGPAQRGGRTNSMVYTLNDLVIDHIEDEHGEYYIEGTFEQEDHPLDGMQMIFDIDNMEQFGITEDDLEVGTGIATLTFVTERIHFGNYRVVVIDIELELD